MKRDDAGTITCPICGHAAIELIPVNTWLYFYEGLGCGVLLRARRGDCCVFFSYSENRCPSKTKVERSGAL
jgi:hypothetical protein